MNAKPLKKSLYEKAKDLGIEKIILGFSGGSDEGFLQVCFIGNDDYAFEQEVEEWAWEVYSYSGAGDGHDYGDDITYDLESGTVTTEEWYHVVQRDGEVSEPLEFEEEEDEEEDEEEPSIDLKEKALSKLTDEEKEALGLTNE